MVWTFGLVCLAGCGPSEDFKLAPVSGTVTLDGQPLVGAGVTFQPEGGGAGNPGPGSAAITDASGKYELQTAEAKRRAGAVVGKHTVRITGTQEQRDASDDTQRPPAKDPVPANYRDPGVPFEVPAGGTDKADFAITTTGSGS
jgi:hypothetical protein